MSAEKENKGSVFLIGSKVLYGGDFEPFKGRIGEVAESWCPMPEGYVSVKFDMDGSPIGLPNETLTLVEDGEMSEIDGLSFEKQVDHVLSQIATMLVEKNNSYGNSALDPVRVFSKASAGEQLKVRIDDKLSRIQRGGDDLGEDTINDLIGYLVLYKIQAGDF